MSPVPQPSIDRLVRPPGRPLVVGVAPGQPKLVLQTAAAWAHSMGADQLIAAYVDVSRVTTHEYPDGSVEHTAIDPDADDQDWDERATRIKQFCQHTIGDQVEWTFHYLAGRPDRALTHLARAVNASGFVIGARRPGSRARLRALLGSSVGARLSIHQHRPVLVVPLDVIDWQVTNPWG